MAKTCCAATVSLVAARNDGEALASGMRRKENRSSGFFSFRFDRHQLLFGVIIESRPFP
jgi:hypothetical protein